MRFRRLMAVPAVIVMLLAACGDDDDDDGGAADTEDGGGGEDTGTVNVLNAMEPEEDEAVQGIVDELINSEADYEAELEAVGQLRGGVPDPRRGRHPRRRAAAPARGGGRRRGSGRRLPRGHGLRHRRARGDLRRVPHGARRGRRRALRPADERQPQEHDLVPEGRLRRRRLHGARDVRRPDRAQRPDRGRRGHALVRRASRPRTPRAGRPPTGWRTSCSAPRAPMSTTSG